MGIIADLDEGVAFFNPVERLNALLLGTTSSEKKKRERAPAVKAQILTRLMIAEGLR
jgi:hypothetical protein